jgi:hypothetical protein
MKVNLRFELTDHRHLAFDVCSVPIIVAECCIFRPNEGECGMTAALSDSPIPQNSHIGRGFLPAQFEGALARR